MGLDPVSSVQDVGPSPSSEDEVLASPSYGEEVRHPSVHVVAESLLEHVVLATVLDLASFLAFLKVVVDAEDASSSLGAYPHPPGRHLEVGPDSAFEDVLAALQHREEVVQLERA